MFKTIGVLAHVDAGKTTLSEQLLYHGGALRTRGRVDQGDAFLDADPQERARGITIFSGQAVFSHRNSVYQLMDTPGHVDFAAEMERSLAILDAAVLVISAPDGVQGHTETIWRRLEALGVPTFLFLNKCDRCDPAPALCELRARLSDDCIDLTDGLQAAAEALAERDEALLETYLADSFDETAFRTAARRMVARRRLFPVFRGSALQDEGVEALLNGLDALLETRYDPAAPFGAQVYGVRRDARGARLALLKITGGTLSPRGRIGEMTVGELRALRGAKSGSLPHAAAGQLCAAAGLPDVKIGDGLGAAAPLPGCALQPLLAAKASWDD
ncbi:MAG: GTP-binding protein, partial [Intestinibacillus sp.]